MKMNKMVPIITVSKFDGIKAFYQNHFGFNVSFESPEYLGLIHNDREYVEIAFKLGDVGSKTT